MKVFNRLKFISACIVAGTILASNVNAADGGEFEVHNREELVQQLRSHGFAILRGAYYPDEIGKLQADAETLVSEFLVEKDSLPHRDEDYTHVFDKVYPRVAKTFDFKNSSVIQISEDRYDLSPLDKTHINTDYLVHPTIAGAMQELIEAPVSSYIGLLPAAAGSSAGVWHRDTMPFKQSYDPAHLESYTEAIEREDLKVQDYYFTVLIPLTDVNAENGATIFQPRSHLLSYNAVQKAQLPLVQPSLKVGDAVIFAGPLFHQGAANTSSDSRLVAYQVWQNFQIYNRHH